MITRITLVLVLLLMICAEGAGNLQSSPFTATFTQEDGKVEFPPAYVPSGRQMYREYCAACHGSDGKGRGPVATSLRKPPPNLTTLARMHGGNFPREYVTNVLRFGPGYSAHGSSEMPVWGTIFQYFENYNESAVRQRIKNLCDYLESIQEK
jgi:mono/diheme cytochrome c family protein